MPIFWTFIRVLWTFIRVLCTFVPSFWTFVLRFWNDNSKASTSVPEPLLQGFEPRGGGLNQRAPRLFIGNEIISIER